MRIDHSSHDVEMDLDLSFLLWEMRWCDQYLRNASFFASIQSARESNQIKSGSKSRSENRPMINDSNVFSMLSRKLEAFPHGWTYPDPDLRSCKVQQDISCAFAPRSIGSGFGALPRDRKLPWVPRSFKKVLFSIWCVTILLGLSPFVLGF